MKAVTNNPETNAMFAELAVAMRECFEVDNATLPKELRGPGKKTSLQTIHRKVSKLEKPSEYQIIQAAKAQRVAAYAAQVEAIGVDHFDDAGVELNYQANEIMLNNAELRFCAAAVRAGYMSFHDED